MKKITLLFLFLCSITAFSQVKLTSETEEYYNGTSWESSNKKTFTYDDNNNLISEKFYFRNNSTSSWEFNSNDTYVYNSANRVVSSTYEGFDGSGNISYGYKTNYTYNANNQIVESINLEFKDGVYVDDYKNIYTYSGNKVTELVDYYWNGSAWVLTADYSSKTTINYGANDLVYEFLYYDWNGSSWSVVDKDVYGYNANNKLTSTIYYDWNGAAYEVYSKEEYTYDSNGNLILERDFDYNNGSFELYSEKNYTFDVTQLMSSFTHPFKDKFGFEALTGQENLYVNKILGYEEDNYRTTYNYGEATASVKGVSFIEFAVYPNPTKNMLTIDDSKFSIENIAIFNVLGKKVFEAQKNNMNIENLVSGVYVVKVQTADGKIGTKRIVKK
ncbi:T9SS type A sorting domain-containing protein [Polaribacter sp.]|uniref:T9SS type A sorting domain-containing protein n=1 Tax=Polaribacter sp. TaxID=1920175 RepID=UPI003EF162B5